MGERCRSCNASIIWGRLPNGNRMPLDFEPKDTGNLVLVRRQGRVLVLPYDPQAHGAGPRRVSHFATCPDAASWRRAESVHSCGGEMHRCDRCEEMVCEAPGHARHACGGEVRR